MIYKTFNYSLFYSFHIVFIIVWKFEKIKLWDLSVEFISF